MQGSPTALVDGTLSRLAELDTLPLPEHAAMYERIYADLRIALDTRSVADTTPQG